MPSGIYVLPWCLLVVGIARVARKADNLISKIGLNPAITGDPLGHGRGMMAVMMAARTIMNSTSKAGKGKAGGGKMGSGPRIPAGSTNIGTNVRSDTGIDARSKIGQSNQNGQSSHFGAASSTVNASGSSSSRFGSSHYTGVNSSGFVSSGSAHFGSTSRVNTNRFGTQTRTSVQEPPAVNQGLLCTWNQTVSGKAGQGSERNIGRKVPPGSVGKSAAVSGFRQNENPFKVPKPPAGTVFVAPSSANHVPSGNGVIESGNLSDVPLNGKGGDGHGE